MPLSPRPFPTPRCSLIPFARGYQPSSPLTKGHKQFILIKQHPERLPSLLKGCKRPGATVVMLLVMLGVLLAAMALAIDGSSLWNARTEMQSGVDASALASTLALADDSLLSNRPGQMRNVIVRARQQAQQFAYSNYVLAQPLELDGNAANEHDGDIVFGFVDDPRAGFQPAPSDATDSSLINAVRITGRRTKERGNPARLFLGRLFQLGSADVLADATAYLDRDVIGFRPVGRQTIPMSPIALLSDPSAIKENSWEAQVVKPATMPEAGGSDAYLHDPVRKKFRRVPTEAPKGDGIFEMEVRLPLQGGVESGEAEDDEEGPNGVLLHVGNGDWATLCRQITGGVGGEDLADWDGQFSLGWDNRLFVPGLYAVPDRQSTQFMQLLNALKTLESTGEPRVWPLFCTLQPTGQEMQATVSVRGFVAARVVSVELVSEPEPQVRIILQPCQLVTATALTDHARAVKAAGSLTNPYIARLRLAD
jgi:hypothetical protein